MSCQTTQNPQLYFMSVHSFLSAQIWSWASNSGGYDVEAMVKATKGTSSLNPETRDKTIRYLVNQMDRVLGYRRPKVNGIAKRMIIQLFSCVGPYVSISPCLFVNVIPLSPLPTQSANTIISLFAPMRDDSRKHSHCSS